MNSSKSHSRLREMACISCQLKAESPTGASSTARQNASCSSSSKRLRPINALITQTGPSCRVSHSASDHPYIRELCAAEVLRAFRIGQIVYVAFSQDETEIGFAFPKEERAALVAARPDVFFLPRESELRFHWIEAWLDALDADEMRELVLDAWRMVVPQRVAREVLGPPAAGHEPGRTG